MWNSIKRTFLLLLENLSSIVLALILAVTVWIVALGEEDPFEERAYPNTIRIQMVGLGETLLIVNTPLNEAAITLRAPASVWDTLVNSQVHITADLTGLGPGEHSVALIGSVDHADVRVLGTEPAVMEVVLEERTDRELPVTLGTVGEPAVGYNTRTTRISPEVVTIDGPASAVDSVSEIVASVSVANMRDSLVQDVALRALNADGRTVSDVTIIPDTIRVSITIRQLGGYRDVAVRAKIEGQVTPGYRVTNIITSPSVVTVFSEEPALVTDIPGFVETEPLDITDASDDIDARLTLDLPEGVSLVGDQFVQVQVGVAALISSLLIEPEIEITGLAPTEEAVLSAESIVVILAGPVPSLDALAVEDVQVIVNVLELELGTHEVEPEVIVLDSDVTVDTILPPTVEVEISRAPPS